MHSNQLIGKSKLFHKKVAISLILILLLIISISTLYILNSTGIIDLSASTDATPTQQEIANDVGKFNAELISLNKQKNKNIPDLEKKAAERKTKMKELIKQNPSQFFKNKLPEEEIALMPESLKTKGLIEKKAKMEGDTFKLYDHETTNPIGANRLFFYNSSNKGDAYEVFFSTQPTVVNPGLTTLNGYTLDELIVIENGTSSAQFSITNTTSNDYAIGKKKVRAFLIDFVDFKKHEFLNSTDIQNKIHVGPDSVSAFMNEVSGGKLTIDTPNSKTYNWITMPAQYSGYSCNSNFNIAAYLNYLRSHYINEYDLFYSDDTQNIFFFDSNCSLGYASQFTQGAIITPFAVLGNDKYVSSRFAIAHEFSHNLIKGNFLGHGNAIDCGKASLRPDLINCTEKEYFDLLSIMGYSMHHMTPMHKKLLGWFTDSQIQTVTTSGTYTISPVENNSPGPKMIRIPGNGMYKDYDYYLSYRDLIGFDAKYPFSPSNDGGVDPAPYLTNVLGINIHIWNGKFVNWWQDAPLLVDSTPYSFMNESGSETSFEEINDFADVTLNTSGRKSYFDPYLKLSISTEGTTSKGQVKINFNSKHPNCNKTCKIDANCGNALRCNTNPSMKWTNWSTIGSEKNFATLPGSGNVLSMKARSYNEGHNINLYLNRGGKFYKRSSSNSGLSYTPWVLSPESEYGIPQTNIDATTSMDVDLEDGKTYIWYTRYGKLYYKEYELVRPSLNTIYTDATSYILVGSGEIQSFAYYYLPDGTNMQTVVRGYKTYTRKSIGGVWKPWEDTTNNFNGVGSGNITAYDQIKLPNKNIRQYLTRNGIVYYRDGYFEGTCIPSGDPVLINCTY